MSREILFRAKAINRDPDDDKQIKVVGNIYDNPELIKEED